MTRPGLVLLAAATLLAGCASIDKKLDGIPDLAAPALEAVQPQLLAAIGAIPDKLVIDATILRGSQVFLKLHGAFDNASGESFLALQADPDTLAALSGGQVSGELLGSRVTPYSTKDGDLFLRNKTGFLFAGANRESALDPGASLRDAPLGKVMDGGSFVRDLLTGAKVTAVTPTSYAGQVALQVIAEVQRDKHNATVAVTLLPVENRVVHLETTLPAGPAGDPLSGATLVADLDHDAAHVVPSEEAARAMSLLHTTNTSIFASQSDEVVWTFLGKPRVLTSEAVVLARASNADLLAGDPQTAALWTYRLSDGPVDIEGVHIVFDDADQDGKIGAGDTLRATALGKDDGVPSLLLSDSTTGIGLLSISL